MDAIVKFAVGSLVCMSLNNFIYTHKCNWYENSNSRYEYNKIRDQRKIIRIGKNREKNKKSHYPKLLYGSYILTIDLYGTQKN